MALPITHIDTILKSKSKSASRTKPSDLVPLIQDKAEQAAVKKLLLSLEERNQLRIVLQRRHSFDQVPFTSPQKAKYARDSSHVFETASYQIVVRESGSLGPWTETATAAHQIKSKLVFSSYIKIYKATFHVTTGQAVRTPYSVRFCVRW
ncbi:hypothetical protein C8J56DRAFT_893891 [Mycena floridula]|nr:hypothetical protein C8J56DRAFT_893891 [Mycena floridula]